jgi:hypothetical protein
VLGHELSRRRQMFLSSENKKFLLFSKKADFQYSEYILVEFWSQP